jgi:hypothetical protein
MQFDMRFNFRENVFPWLLIALWLAIPVALCTLFRIEIDDWRVFFRMALWFFSFLEIATILPNELLYPLDKENLHLHSRFFLWESIIMASSCVLWLATLLLDRARYGPDPTEHVNIPLNLALMLPTTLVCFLAALALRRGAQRTEAVIDQLHWLMVKEQIPISRLSQSGAAPQRSRPSPPLEQ